MRRPVEVPVNALVWERHKMILQHDLAVIKEWAQILGLFAVIFGLLKAAYEIQQSRRQRETELLWKKINTAKELLNDIHTHDLAKQAVHMLDWCEGHCNYDLTSGRREVISYVDVMSALRKNHVMPENDKDVFIRDCFDWFFYRVDRIEHYIRRKLIDFADVESVFRPYANQIAKDRQTYEDFLAFHEYDLARQFFNRYGAVNSL
jgi:hypothetical protein